MVLKYLSVTNLAFTVMLICNSVSAHAGGMAGVFVFPGTWYTDVKGIPRKIEIHRFTGATVNGVDCDWEAASFESFVDAISISCPNKLRFMAGLMSYNGEYSGRYLSVSFPTKGIHRIKGDYYPSLEALNAKRMTKELEPW